MHTVLCRQHRLLIQSWYRCCALYLILQFSWKVFAQICSTLLPRCIVNNTLSKWQMLTLLYELRAFCRMCRFSGALVPFYSPYSLEVWHGLTSEAWRNVSGSALRIPQSFETRSLHWQESATYFSMRTANSPSPLYLFQVCPSLSFHFILSSFVLPSCSLCCLLVNLSACLSVTPSILLSYFAYWFSRSLFCLLFVPMHSCSYFFSYSCL